MTCRFVADEGGDCPRAWACDAQEVSASGYPAWAGLTTGLPDVYPVRINHYWSQFKPWAIGCPVYASYGWVDSV